MDRRSSSVLPRKYVAKRNNYSFSYILSSFVFIFLLIFQVIFSNSLQSFDLNLIVKIQQIIPDSLYKSGVFKWLAIFFENYMEFIFINGFLCVLYCSFNPFIVFKIALFSNLAIYLHTVFIVLIYREPRPYWTTSGLKTMDCQAIFTGPSYTQFMATLLMLYFIRVFRHYQVITKTIPLILFIIFLVIMNVLTIIVNVIHAQNFLYQSLLGVLIAIIVILITYGMDDSITLLTLKVGFFMKSSKKYKFLLLIILLLIFSVCLIFIMITESEILVLPEWIKNYTVSQILNLGNVLRRCR